MDFGFDDEQLLLSDTLREFALSELAPVAERWRTEPFPRELIGRLGELGLLGLRIPAEYGGSDGSYVALGIAAEELSHGMIHLGLEDVADSLPSKVKFAKPAESRALALESQHIGIRHRHLLGSRRQHTHGDPRRPRTRICC